MNQEFSSNKDFHFMSLHSAKKQTYKQYWSLGWQRKGNNHPKKVK